MLLFSRVNLRATVHKSVLREHGTTLRSPLACNEPAVISALLCVSRELSQAERQYQCLCRPHLHPSSCCRDPLLSALLRHLPPKTGAPNHLTSVVCGRRQLEYQFRCLRRLLLHPSSCSHPLPASQRHEWTGRQHQALPLAPRACSRMLCFRACWGQVRLSPCCATRCVQAMQIVAPALLLQTSFTTRGQEHSCWWRKSAVSLLGDVGVALGRQACCA